MPNNRGGERPGAGRPIGSIKPPEDKRKNRCFKATDAEFDKITILSKNAGMNVSKYIRTSILGGDT
jgi:hypothetical protein